MSLNDLTFYGQLSLSLTLVFAYIALPRNGEVRS